MKLDKDFVSHPLLHTLSQEEIDYLSEIYHLKVYPDGEIIFLEDEEADCFYIVLEGEIQIIKTSEEGKEKILKVLEKGDFFGEMGIVEDARRSATARVRKSAKLLMINRNDFLKFINNNPQFAFKMIVELSQRLREADRQIEELAFLDVKARLKKMLIRISEKSGEQLVIKKRITHQELARLIGSTRETVTRIMNELKEKDLLSYQEDSIFLKKIARW